MKRIALGIFVAGALLSTVVAFAGPRVARRIAMSVVASGFLPDRIDVKKDEPLTLVITRKTEKTCATAVVIKEFGIHKELPLNTPVEISKSRSRRGRPARSATRAPWT